jgi:hypothetical protein
MSRSQGQDTAIVLDFTSQQDYRALLQHRDRFRDFLLDQFAQHPELFPDGFAQGFRFHGFRSCKKHPHFQMRRIVLKANGMVYSVRPSFMHSYMRQITPQVEKALFLRRWNVPFSALTYCFGHNDMFWYRLFTSLGRPSLVGTTVKKETPIPVNLLADEKHTRWVDEKAYVATTVGGGCFLGAKLVSAAGEDELTEAHREFAQEVREQEPDYQAETVLTDGWQATKNAFLALFVGIVVIGCFLHAWLSIRKRCKRDKELLCELGTRVWEVYRAPSLASFSQRIRRLREWTDENVSKEAVKAKVLALCDKKEEFTPSFEHPGSYRTSNALDRLMDYQDRVLYAMRYLHAYDQERCNLYLRANALIWNFHPFSPRTLASGDQSSSPFERLNGFQYHQNWLHNLLIASSVGGKSHSHQNR